MHWHMQDLCRGVCAWQMTACSAVQGVSTAATVKLGDVLASAFLRTYLLFCLPAYFSNT